MCHKRKLCAASTPPTARSGSLTRTLLGSGEGGQVTAGCSGCEAVVTNHLNTTDWTIPSKQEVEGTVQGEVLAVPCHPQSGKLEGGHSTGMSH